MSNGYTHIRVEKGSQTERIVVVNIPCLGTQKRKTSRKERLSGREENKNISNRNRRCA